MKMFINKNVDQNYDKSYEQLVYFKKMKNFKFIKLI